MTLELSHPAFQDRDIEIPMARSLPDADGNATWSGHFASVPDGRWYTVLHADDWRLNGTWSGDATLTLRPASHARKDPTPAPPPQGPPDATRLSRKAGLCGWRLTIHPETGVPGFVVVPPKRDGSLRPEIMYF